MMNEKTIEKLTARGFNRWTKGKYDRLYVNAKDLGLECEYYKTGNIADATFRGEGVSNSEAYRMKSAKTYIDVNTEEVVSTNRTLEEAAAAILEEVKAEIEAEEATEKKAEEAETVEETEEGENMDKTGKHYEIYIGEDHKNYIACNSYAEAEGIARTEAEKPENDGKKIRIAKHNFAAMRNEEVEIFRDAESATEYSREEIEEVADRIRTTKRISDDDCAELCKMAGLEWEWGETAMELLNDTWKDVLAEAAKRLDVKIDRKYFYAVQVGDNYDWDYGSDNYDEAVEMASDEAADPENDGLEIRIAKIDTDCSECENVEWYREIEEDDSPSVWN